MVAAFNISSSRDVVKRPQSVDEGNVVSAPTTYGVVPVNPVFVDVGQNATLEATSVPALQETRNSGDVDRVDSTKTREHHSAKLMYRLTDNNVALTKWAANKPNGAGTSDISKTFVKSYFVNGIETFIVCRGCLPTHSEIGFDDENFLVMIIDLDCKSITVTQAANGGITLGTGAFATPSIAVAWKGDDGGIDQFVYNATPYAESGFKFVTDFELAKLLASENQQQLHAKVTKRSCSGNIVIPKKDILISADAQAGTKRTVSRVLKTGQLTITITGLQWQDHKEPAHDPQTSSVTLEDKPFIADSFTLA